MAEFLRIHLQQAVNVIELELPDTIDAMEFDRINELAVSALDGRAAQQWVLDLAAVDYLGSAMLGLIVNIRQQIKAAGGKLVLCGMSPALTEIFQACSMERLFNTVGTRGDAIRRLTI